MCILLQRSVFREARADVAAPGNIGLKLPVVMITVLLHGINRNYDHSILLDLLLRLREFVTAGDRRYTLFLSAFQD